MAAALAAAGVVAALCPALCAAQGSFQITGVVTQLVDGGNPTNAAITGSGSTTNTTPWTFDSRARFLLSSSNLTVGFEVAPVGATGSMTTNTDSLMIARTVNSQGLTDPGTLSVYVNRTSAWSLDLAFRFYDTNFIGLIPVRVLVTSFDIDYSQRYSIVNSQFVSYTVATNTALAITNTGPLTVFTAAGDAVFEDPQFAVSALTGTNQSEFTLRFEHNAVALFMLEFRDPSEIVTLTKEIPIPEPAVVASLALAAGGAALVRGRKRRSG